MSNGLINRQYVGARYVPKIMGEWNKALQYEALSVVTYMGNSFTSKVPVPANSVDINNTDYWINTGNYNAQVEEYKQIVETLETKNTGYAKLNGKKIHIIGDSISDTSILANNWAIQFKAKAENYGASVTIDGISGAALTSDSSTGIGSVNQRFIAKGMGCDILIIELGVNDWILGHTLGDISTAIQELNNTMLGLTKTPDVYWIMPTVNKDPRISMHPLPLDIYRAYYAQYAFQSGWNIIDGARVPHLSVLSNTSIEKYYLGDGYFLHPNEIGSKYLCQYVFDNLVYAVENNIMSTTSIIDLSSFVASGTTLRYGKLQFTSDFTCILTMEGYVTLDSNAKATILNKIDCLSYQPNNKGSVYGSLSAYDTDNKCVYINTSWIPNEGLSISAVDTSKASQVIAFNGEIVFNANPGYNYYGNF